MTLPAKDLDRAVKFASMLGSDQEGERGNALRMLVRLLQDNKLTVGEVFEKGLKGASAAGAATLSPGLIRTLAHAVMQAVTASNTYFIASKAAASGTASQPAVELLSEHDKATRMAAAMRDRAIKTSRQSERACAETRRLREGFDEYRRLATEETNRLRAEIKFLRAKHDDREVFEKPAEAPADSPGDSMANIGVYGVSYQARAASGPTTVDAKQQTHWQEHVGRMMQQAAGSVFSDPQAAAQQIWTEPLRKQGTP